MEVILKEDVPKLGSRGDVVKVAEGFGRNYLLPHKLAIEASKGNKAVIEQMKAASVRRSAKEKTSAEAVGFSFSTYLGGSLDDFAYSHQRRQFTLVQKKPEHRQGRDNRRRDIIEHVDATIDARVMNRQIIGKRKRRQQNCIDRLGETV